MGNTTYEIEQRRKKRLEKEQKDRQWANGIAARIVAEINSVIIRPGPRPEERECITVAAELSALQPRIAAIILDEESYLTEAEFKEQHPDRAFTWDLDEHPTDGNDICACRSCRELSQEG